MINPEDFDPSLLSPTPEQILIGLKSVANITILYQFILPWVLTILFVGAKYLQLISVTWLILFTPVMVSTAVGLALLATIILLSLFVKAAKYE